MTIFVKIQSATHLLQAKGNHSGSRREVNKIGNVTSRTLKHLHGFISKRVTEANVTNQLVSTQTFIMLIIIHFYILSIL